MRVLVGDDGHAALLQAGNGVRCRHFDPIDLARQQRCRPRCRLRHGEQDHLVELGNARLFPVVGVARELHALARHDAVDLERAGARGLQRDLVPVLALLLPIGRAGIEDVGHVVGKQRIDDAGRQFDRVLVDRLVTHEGRDAGAHLGELLGIELGRLVVQDLIEIPDHGVGIEVRTVVEFDALAQLEDPALGVAFDRRPRCRETRPDVGDHVSLR